MEVQVLSPPILSLYVCYGVTVVKTYRVFLLSHPLSEWKVKSADEQVDRFFGTNEQTVL